MTGKVIPLPVLHGRLEFAVAVGLAVDARQPACIAVELPEAVRDSTHYRTLFLAALVLFIMTFTVNTIAEAVRLHFRKRAVEL